MPLSDDEREKIREEELIRLGTREEYVHQKHGRARKLSLVLLSCGGAMALLVLIIAVMRNAAH
jgi:hypothetical protein